MQVAIDGGLNSVDRTITDVKDKSSIAPKRFFFIFYFLGRKVKNFVFTLNKHFEEFKML